MTRPLCDKCGTPMVKFENPERWKCPRQDRHKPNINYTTPSNHGGGTKKGTPSPRKGKKK